MSIPFPGRRVFAVVAAAAFVAGLFAALAATPLSAGLAGSTVASDPAPLQATPSGRLSPCAGVMTTTMQSHDIQLCEQLEVAAHAAPYCPVCPNGVNVVYVQVDAAFHADWMDRESVQSLNELLRYSHLPMKIGVIHYDSQAVRIRLQMTENVAAARGPLNEPPYGHDPFGLVEEAAQEALGMLRDERDGSRRAEDGCEFIVFFASTKNIYPEQEAAIRRAGQMIHRENVTLFVGCPETHPDYCHATEDMPRNRRFYTEAPSGGQLRRMVADFMRELEDEGESQRLRSAVMEQFVPKELTVDDASFSVEPTEKLEVTDSGTLYRWTLGRPNSAVQAQTITYQAKPEMEGHFAITGSLKIVDMDNKPREVPMPAVPITVAGNCVTPTVPPTPDATDTPQPTPTDPPTATSTPTPRPEPIYLPIVLREECTLQWVHSDVALVLDLSTSMNRLTSADRTKLAAAQEAAKKFVDLMDFTPNSKGQLDRVAIVGFNKIGWIQSELSSDREALYTAIDRLPERQDQYTRLDLAFEYGALAVAPEKRMAGNTPVIVLLTDGLPNQVPYAEDGTVETTVRRAADAAKAAEVRIYTVGLGAPEDINAELLTECATEPELYFYAPDAERLADIYSEIAYSFGCPRERHDWTEPWP